MKVPAQLKKAASKISAAYKSFENEANSFADGIIEELNEAGIRHDAKVEIYVAISGTYTAGVDIQITMSLDEYVLSSDLERKIPDNIKKLATSSNFSGRYAGSAWLYFQYEVPFGN